MALFEVKRRLVPGDFAADLTGDGAGAIVIATVALSLAAGASFYEPCGWPATPAAGRDGERGPPPCRQG
jgi:bifunctional ADP-heptose synthase (sugar kinase/adenylyltransferase)